MSNPWAKIIADSITEDGDRLTTVEVRIHRFVLAQLNTHRAFSRNSSSSRAIPIPKMVERVQKDPALPLQFGTKKQGMQAGPPLEGEDLAEVIEVWLEAAENATRAAQRLDAMGVHKEVANRLLEPFLWHTAIISSTEWDNFFNQRAGHDAQPEMAIAAELIRSVMQESEPQLVPFRGWHMPYLCSEDYNLPVEQQLKISVARCARVSYLTHDGKRSVDKDLDLYETLVSANPPHYSPLEHVATPVRPAHLSSANGFVGSCRRTPGNFEGWNQLRHLEQYQ